MNTVTLNNSYMNAVKLNNFSLDIEAKYEHIEKYTRNDNNYFAIPDGTEYKLKLENDNGVKVDAHVWIDGEKIGIWRIKPYDDIVIERPAEISRKFTFLKEGSRRANRAGIMSGKSDNGLIKVVFKPEKKEEIYPRMMFNCLPSKTALKNNIQFDCIIQQRQMDYQTENYSSGATALGDDSNQRFGRAESIKKYDYDLMTTIHARLVVNDNYYMNRSPYIGLSQALNSNKIPPRVDLYWGHNVI